MTDRRAVAIFLLGPRFNPDFWDDVDYEVETLDPDDFAEFEAADELPLEPRPEFEHDLRRQLHTFLVTRYGRSNDE